MKLFEVEVCEIPSGSCGSHKGFHKALRFLLLPIEFVSLSILFLEFQLLNLLFLGIALINFV